MVSTTLSRIHGEGFTQHIPSFSQSHLFTDSFLRLLTLQSPTLSFTHSFTFSLTFTLCVNQDALKNRCPAQRVTWRCTRKT